MSETSDVVNPAIEKLNTMSGTFAWRINSGKLNRGSIHVYLGPEGMPDIGIVRNGRFYGCECKRSPKEKLRESQEKMACALWSAGAVVYRANTAKEVVDKLLQLEREN